MTTRNMNKGFLHGSRSSRLSFNAERYSEWLAVWPDFKLSLDKGLGGGERETLTLATAVEVYVLYHGQRISFWIYLEAFTRSRALLIACYCCLIVDHALADACPPPPADSPPSLALPY